MKRQCRDTEWKQYESGSQEMGQQRIGAHSAAVMQAARLELNEAVDVREESVAL